jgi:hypothetical protein
MLISTLLFPFLSKLNFHFSTSSRPALGPTRPPFQWVNWPGREADRSRPTSAEVKEMWIYTSTFPIHVHGLVLN